MEKLRQQASSQGGVVLSHLGNHEWMNAIGVCVSLHTFWFLLLNNLFTGDWR